MKSFSLILILSAYTAFVHAQSKKIDSLNNLIAKAKSDTQRINLSIQKIGSLENIDFDSAIVFGTKVIDDAKKIQYKKGEADARIMLSYAYCFKGGYATAKATLDTAKNILTLVKDSTAAAKMYDNYGIMYSMQSKYDTALIYYPQAIKIAEALKDNLLISTIAQNIAIAYQQQSKFPQALQYYQKALTISEKANDKEGEAYIYLNMAITFSGIQDTARSIQYYLKATKLADELDLKTVTAYAYSNLSSLYSDQKKFKEQYEYGMKAAALAKLTGDDGIQASSLARAALALALQNKFQEAENLCRQAMHIADSSHQPLNIYQTYETMGDILKTGGNCNDAIAYFEKALQELTDADLYDFQVVYAYFSLSDCYEKKGEYSKALTAFKTATRINDSLQNKENIRKATELTLNYEFDKKQQIAKAEQEKKDAIAKRIKNQQYFIITALGIVALAVVIIASIQFKNNRQKQKAYNLLQKQKKETDEQKQKVEETLSELKSAQAQLIQSEKMASLGELTAGIAHEIQNPLNFVNNFSEVNRELVDEMKNELAIGNMQQAIEIADDIKDNEEKINHHGKRADAIVKGMLQHSRKSEGKKEPTDINALCDEYLRLSYHGMRAKDKNFNAEFKSEFDESIGKINIVPQDIGRVLLNLFNNAFYAVKTPNPLKGEQYKPLVSVITRKITPLQGMGAKVEIIVSDNGNGIPQNIVDKIFQPFFTTKPTGQGTGLGLSLSYDIIKAHDGEIKVETKEGEGSEFVIQLPIN